MLTVPVTAAKDAKVTAAVWSALDEYIITGHENGEIRQYDAKVVRLDTAYIFLLRRHLFY